MEICILAGGLSSRMGSDKAKLRIGGKTLVAWIKLSAQETGLPVRIVRRDIVERCGPLGGVYTALNSSEANAILFLACDMPFVTADFLRGLIEHFGPRSRALFSSVESKAGFPFILHKQTLPVIERQLEEQRFPLQALAQKLNAKLLSPRSKDASQLFNINTPLDRKRAGEIFGETAKKRSA